MRSLWPTDIQVAASVSHPSRVAGAVLTVDRSVVDGRRCGGVPVPLRRCSNTVNVWCVDAGSSLEDDVSITWNVGRLLMEDGGDGEGGEVVGLVTDFDCP